MPAPIRLRFGRKPGGGFPLTPSLVPNLGNPPLARPIMVRLAPSRPRNTIRTTYFLRAPLVVFTATVHRPVVVRLVKRDLSRLPATLAVLQPWTIRGPPVAESLPKITVKLVAPRARRTAQAQTTQAHIFSPPVIADALTGFARPIRVALAPSRPRKPAASRLFPPAVVATTAPFVASPIAVHSVRAPRTKPVQALVRRPVAVADAITGFAPPVKVSTTKRGPARPVQTQLGTPIVSQPATPPFAPVAVHTVRRPRVPPADSRLFPAAVIDRPLAPKAKVYLTQRPRLKPTQADIRPPAVVSIPTVFTARPVQVELARFRRKPAWYFLRAPVVVGPAASSTPPTPLQQDIFVNIAPPPSRARRRSQVLYVRTRVFPPAQPTPLQQDVFVSYPPQMPSGRRRYTYFRIKTNVVPLTPQPPLRESKIRVKLSPRARIRPVQTDVRSPRVIGAFNGPVFTSPGVCDPDTLIVPICDPDTLAVDAADTITMAAGGTDSQSEASGGTDTLTGTPGDTDNR